MEDNAIIIRPLDVIKTHVDFSNIDNIPSSINVERVSTIHTEETQRISKLLGIHLIGFVDRDSFDINNPLACKISGYDQIGSLMLLCKTDDKYNPLPFTKEELEKVYRYLLTEKGMDEAIEEVMELDEGRRELDFLVPYILIFDIDANWPNVVKLTHKGTYAFPMLQHLDETINIPCFPNLIEIEGYDRIHQSVDLILHFGEDIHINVKNKQEEVIKFSFQSDKETPTTLREGTIKIRLELFNFITDGGIEGNVKINEDIILNKKEFHEEKVIEQLDLDLIESDDGDACTMENTGNFYFAWLLDPNRDFVLLVQKAIDPNGGEEQLKLYIPLFLNKPVINIEEYIESEQSSIFTYSFVYRK